MAYSFDQIFAADPANPSNVAANAAITIYQPGDPTKSPLVITDPSGGALSNPITVNANGFGSAFMHATMDRVAWDGGGFTGFFTSYEGIKNEAVDARTAAEAAAANAGTEAAAVATAAIGDATSDAEAAALSAAAAASDASDSATAATNAAALVGAPADTAVEALVNATGSATRVALNANFATAAGLATKAGISDIGVSKASRVFRLAVLGNSWDDGTSSSDTNEYATTTPIYTDSTWYNVAIAMSMGKIVRGGNYGIGGQTTAQVVARVPDVIAANPRPNACVIGELTNTIGGVTDDATVLGAVDALFTGADQLAAAGIIPIIRNCPARGTTGTPKTDNERRQVALANTKIARLAALRGYPLVDFHKVTVDPSSGKLLDASSTDGVHINKVYTRKTAEAVLDVVLPMAGGYSPFLANWNADPTNLLTNGLFLGTTTLVGGYTMPTGWNGGTNNQRAITAPVTNDKLLGNWFDLYKDATVGAATATDYTSTTQITAGTATFEAGDRLRFSARVRVEDIENTVASTGAQHFASLTLFCAGAAVNAGPLYQYQANVPDAVAVVEFTVPTGTTYIQVQAGIAGQGKLRIGQATLRNLTKLSAL